MRTYLTLGVTLLLISGCVNDNNNMSGVQGLGSKDAETLNSQHGKFDTATDPAFTAPTRYAAGQLAESQNAPAAAIEQYKAALKVDPKHQPSLYRLGLLYTNMRRFPEAVEAWRQYIKATNNSAAAYGNLGFCYEHAGQTREAEAAYLDGIKQDPKNKSCRVNYGLMLVRLGRIDEGREQMSFVLKPSEVHYNVGSVYEHQGRTDEAKSEYEKVLEIDPQFWEAKSRLSRLE